MGKLTATGVKAMRTPGRYGDGDGLFLLVGKSGGKSWVLRVQKDGKRRDIGLGSAAKVPLATARQKAAETRIAIEAGLDPVAERRKAAGIPTFRQAAALVCAELGPTFRNAKHRAQWLSSLENHAFPTLGDTSVARIDAPAVRDTLAAIWLTHHETARRVRQRIVAVINWAQAKGYRDSALPMAVINKALPKVKAKPKHHRALPYADLPAFLAKLRERESMGRLALEMVVLTAARSGEVRGMTWAEIDTEAALWTIPAERMKADRPHNVPLSKSVLALLERMKAHRRGDSDLVFPGQARGKGLSDMTLAKVLRDMAIDAVPHGLRSSFRDWVAEQTSYPRELAEKALSHVVKDATEAAYQRGDMLEKRRPMMQAWADHCEGAAGSETVVPFRP